MRKIELREERRIRCDARELDRHGLRVAQAERVRRAADDEDGEHEAARHAAQIKREAQHEPEECEEHHRIREVAELDDRVRAATDELRFLKADLDEEQADADRDRRLQRRRHGIGEQRPQARAGNNGEQHARDERDGERLLPCEPHRRDDRVREERVDAHAGRQDDRRVRVECHDQTAEHGRKDRRKNRKVGRNAAVRKNHRVDDDDVRDGKKSREAGDDFFPHVRPEQRLQLLHM